MNLCTCRNRAGVGKRSFLTREDAEANIPGTLAMIGDRFDCDRDDMHAYRCVSGWWHLGTNPKTDVVAPEDEDPRADDDDVLRGARPGQVRR